MGIAKKANTALGQRALQMGDLRLVENSSERRGALDSDAIESETARDGGQ